LVTLGTDQTADAESPRLTEPFRPLKTLGMTDFSLSGIIGRKYQMEALTDGLCALLFASLSRIDFNDMGPGYFAINVHIDG
jgi:hypothetical protein